MRKRKRFIERQPDSIAENSRSKSALSVVPRLKRLFPEIDASIAEEHAKNLSPRYFEVFSREEIHTHLAEIERLTPANPVRIVFESLPASVMRCTVTAYDYPFEFSLLAGILSASGMNILTGDVFTYGEPGSHAAASPKRKPPVRPKIIDRFTGTVSSNLSPSQWEKAVSEKAREIILLLESGTPFSVTKAKEIVNMWVSEALAGKGAEIREALMPITLDIDSSGPSHTTIRIVSEDSPFFLYSVSAALALKGIYIYRVNIKTEEGKITDEFDVAGASGRKITDPAEHNRIRVSVLLTKQFTYFLGSSPDPYSALVRFESLVDRVTDASAGRLIESLSDTATMRELAKLLGSSDFLWEDFIRLNYEQLLPMLSDKHRKDGFIVPEEELERELDEAVGGEKDIETKKRLLNETKDRRIFFIDLQHILIDNFDFAMLSRRLVRLAESVIGKSFAMHYEHLAKRFGTPRSIAGQPARFALFGLGKFGGEDLGYASDIEVLFIYSDRGNTDGRETIANSEFFETLVRDATLAIEAKREGIFRIDLRLRPYGASSQLAVSLDQLCRYYAKGGGAHSLERLAMVRLRAVWGDPGLGSQVERIRDELIYVPQNISFDELVEARSKQLEERHASGSLNAKYSRGALVDLEYAVQFLQIKHAGVSPGLKTPIMGRALEQLAACSLLTNEESSRLTEAYNFFRRLINGLRMLRGSAFDLSIPPPDTDEFAHLARRMGYESSGDLTSFRKLYMEFETRSAMIRVFLDKHLGKESIIGEAVTGIPDIILFKEISALKAKAILRAAGFENQVRAFVNIRNMADKGSAAESFARLSVLAFDILHQMPDMDMALNNWERFVSALDSPQAHYESLLAQPAKLAILMRIFSGSQFISDTLIRYPELLDSVVVTETINKKKELADYEAELEAALGEPGTGEKWLDSLRLYRKREILRTGTRDICLGIDVREIVAEISALAEAIVRKTLARVQSGSSPGARCGFCILAFGKLGGMELNYSSDIDIIGIFDDKLALSCEEEFGQLMEKVIACLGSHTDEGHAYRIDLRLRPFGSAGSIVTPCRKTVEYYRNHADLREIQALIKLRPIAGDIELGNEFVSEVRKNLFIERDKSSVADMITRAIKGIHARSGRGINIKTGPGGIRSIEFLVQGLQMIHSLEAPQVIEANTLAALSKLAKAGLMEPGHASAIEGHYVYLRKLEHFLQIFEDQKTHVLPSDVLLLSSLVKRIEGKDMTNERFLALLGDRLVEVERIRGKYTG